MNSVAILRLRGDNLVRLNAFLREVQPLSRRKRAVMALYEADVITAIAAQILIEHHDLEAA